MFSSIFRRNSSADTEASNEPSEVAEVLEPITIDFAVELGSGKGIPHDVQVIAYHQHQGYLCVGTSTGAVFVYGHGFQYLRTCLIEETSVANMLCIYPDQLLVVYSDNTLACYEIPKLTLNSILNPSQWMSVKYGNIVFVYTDEDGQRPFAYVATEDGTCHILDTSNNMLRVCDYSIPLAKSGQPTNSILSCLRVCPKDEKYLALGFSGPDRRSGAVVIYDLSKQKVYKQFNSSAVTCMTWSHNGDVLYTGSVFGEVFSLLLDKLSFGPIYNSRSSRISEDSEDVVISIEKLTWLPPQGSMGLGCLFLQLGIADDSIQEDMINLVKEVIVALAPAGKGGDMKQVYSLTPLPYKSLLTYHIVPTLPYLSMPSIKSRSASISSNISSANADDETCSTDTNISNQILPAVLLLTKMQSSRRDNGPTESSLMIASLPKGNVLDWMLDIGSILSPKEVWLTQCGSGHVTTINASKPTTLPHSFVGVLISYHKIIARENEPSSSYPTASESHIPNPPYIKSKLDISDYIMKLKVDLAENGDDDEDDDNLLDEDLSMDICTSHGDIDTYEANINHPCDIVFVGQDDGYVMCWGVTRPADPHVDNRNNMYLPLLAFKNGYKTIEHIVYDDSCGLMIVSDRAGKVLVWEVFDSSVKVGYIDHMKHSLLAVNVENTLQENATEEPEDTNNTGESLASIMSSFKPTSIRFAFTIDGISQKITKMKIIPEYMILVIGTILGEVFTIALYDQRPTIIPVSLNSLGLSEPVSGIYSSVYLKMETAEYVPAIYVCFQSCCIVVIHPISHEILAYTAGPYERGKPVLSQQLETVIMEDSSDHSGDGLDYSSKVPISHSTAFGCVLDNHHDVIHHNALTNPTQIISSTTRAIVMPEETKINPRKSVLPFFRATEPTPVAPVAAPSELKKSASGSTPVKLSPPTTDIPTTFLLLSGRRLLTYNITRFSIPKKGGQNLISGLVSSFISNNMSNSAVVSKIISTADIVSGNIVSYIEEATRAWSDPLPCLLLANTAGGVLALRLKDRSSVGYINLFDNLLPSPITFNDGVVLQNGDIYFTQKGSIYSARASSTTHILSQPLPSRGIVISFSSMTMQLSSGREKYLASSHDKASKRRQSSLLSSNGTDLEKIFSKKKDFVQMKEELFGEAREQDQSDNRDIDTDKVKQVTKNVKSTAAIINETRDVLIERGERLEQLSKDTEELRQGAATFHENAKAQKEILKQRNSRWSIFK